MFGGGKSEKLEVAVVTIVFKPCVEATYLLEGDNCCSLITYEVIQQRLNAWFGDHLSTLTFPELDAVIDETAASMNETVPQIHDRIHVIMDSAVQYFNSRINEILSEDINLYRICGMANPVMLRRFEEPDRAIFREPLTQLEYIDATVITNMMMEYGDLIFQTL